MTNTASDFAGLEFAPGEVFGSRSFKVDQLGRLTGVAYETVWRPGENTAECKMTSPMYEVRSYYPSLYEKLTGEKVTLAGPAPVSPMGAIIAGIGTYSYSPTSSLQPPMTERDRKRVCDIEHDMTKCGHGFYGYYEGSNDYGDQGQVNGVIRGWGETLIGTRGFRCGKAEIVALHIKNSTDKHLVERIHRNYPDIAFFDDYKTMIAEFPPDPGANALKGPDSPEFWELEL